LRHQRTTILSVTSYTHPKPIANDNQHPSDVWSSHYMMVHHLNESSGTHYDSTSYNNDGTPYNDVTQDALGKIDGGDSFDGSNDYISVSDSSSVEVSAPATITFWFNSSQSGATTILIEKNGSPGLSVQKEGATDKMKVNVGNVEALQTIDTYNDGTWHHIAYVLNETTSLSKVYVDGIDDTDGTPNYATPSYGTENLYIGSRASSFPYGGLLDEIRISDKAYGSAWIIATYSTESNSLLSYGEEENRSSQAPIIANEIPEDEATSIELNPTLSINTYDPQGNTMNISFYTNSSGTWEQIGTVQTGGNDIYAQATTMFTNYAMKYWWSVNATDPVFFGGSGNWTNRTFSFTTKPAIIVSNPYPLHNAVDISLEPTLSIQVNHSSGDSISITWMTNASTDSCMLLVRT
ncbi:Concanavalin A-like lectin/glucanases superfamily, partial [Thermoplasmatales archaeon SCGC AB-540-F20]